MTDIISVINELISNLYSTVEDEVYTLLDKLLVIDSKILEVETIKKLSLNSENSSIAIFCSCFISMFLVCFAIKKIVLMYNSCERPNLFKFILRIIFFTILMSSSYYICECIIELNSLFTDLLINIGKDVCNFNISFQGLRDVVARLDTSNGYLSLNGAIKGLVGFGATSMIFSFCVRYVTVILLIILAPVSFMCGITSSTVGILKKWFKMFLLNLIFQNIVIVILIIPLSITYSKNIEFNAIIVGSIYMLYKVNTFLTDILSDFNIRREGR